jgi:hypothetical protein
MNAWMDRNGYGLAVRVGISVVLVYLVWLRESLLLAGGLGLIVIGIAGSRLESLTIGPIALKMFKERAARAFTKKLEGSLTFRGDLDVRRIPADLANARTPEEFGDRLADIVITPEPERLNVTTHPPTVSVSGNPPLPTDDDSLGWTTAWGIWTAGLLWANAEDVSLG